MQDQQTSQPKHNPLSHWYRQPKIYIKLPSRGEFYPPGSLDLSATGDYAVYAMTAKDELMFKTPDALLNGQSTVDVIKSCIPAILDPWKMPTLDVDAALIAIRVATYGEKMDISAKCPGCDEENTFQFPLTDWLGNLSNFTYESHVQVGELLVHVRPYSYREITKSSLKAFEQQRTLAIINDDAMSESEKMEKFSDSFSKLTEMTVDIIAGCISKIETPNGSTDNSDHILDFIHNASSEVFNSINEHVQGIKIKIEIPAQDATCSACKLEYRIPITMDQSNFFAVRS